jgi:hypothetical protein
MAFAFVQEFDLDEAGDRSTANYDEVARRLEGEGSPPDGLILHTAGFDDEARVFRVFDVWESPEHAQRFIDERLMPIVEELFAGREDTPPPKRQYFYELHDVASP